MKRILPFALLALVLCAVPLSAAEISGKYIEARTCDIWTGPCFANAEVNLSGKHAVLGWKVDKGALDRVRLDGLGVVAVVAASDTLGTKQTGTPQAVLIVDSRANAAQKAALVRLARRQGGALLRNVVRVDSARVDLDICPCEENGCATLRAGAATIATRCINASHDKVCGNESAFYPPLVRNVKVRPALAVEHRYTGKGVRETWDEPGRRGAYLGTFEAR
jgi:hypothetical protein